MTDYLFSWYSRLGTNSIICSVKDWTHGTHTIHNNNNNNSVKKYWVLNAKCNGLRQKRLFMLFKKVYSGEIINAACWGSKPKGYQSEELF